MDDADTLVELQPRPFRVVFGFTSTEILFDGPPDLTRPQAEHLLIAALRMVQLRTDLDPWQLLDEMSGGTP